MKKKISTLMMIAVTVLLSSIANAQTWNLAGNTNATAASRLGTNNNIPLRLFTNNAEQVHINANTAGKVGFVGMGTTAPNTRLHVNGVVTATGGTSTNWNTAYTRVASTYSNNRIPRWNGTAFVNGSVSDNGNNVGIGTTSPENKLHVFKGSAGTVTGYVNASLILESSVSNYINLLVPDGSETGILFGKASDVVSGGIIYDHLNTPNGLQFRTNGNVARMVLTEAGSLGVGTLLPGLYRAKVTHSNYGFNLESSATGNNWEQYVSTNLSLFNNGAPRGNFSATTGAYSAGSDERIKTNIQPMGTMLEKINQLKPSVYQFKNTDDKQYYNGFIAQEVMQLFPSLVTHTVIPERDVDFYSMDYSGFGVIAIKGIQELNEKLTMENEALKSRLDQLESAMSQCYTNHTSGKSATEQSGMTADQSRLEHNTPNPFNKSTVIKYYVPENFSSAQMKIYSAQGVEIKSIPIMQSGRGEISVEANSLSAGIYTYTLIVDDSSVDVKQMIVTK